VRNARARTYPGLQGWRRCLAEPCWVRSVAGYFSKTCCLRVASTDVGMVESRVRTQVVGEQRGRGWQQVASQRETASSLAFVQTSTANQRPCTDLYSCDSSHMSLNTLLIVFHFTLSLSI
jgi:hypothetical protein